MFANFNLYKANKFLERTKQPKQILNVIESLSPYYETDLLDMIEHLTPCRSFELKVLYCSAMEKMDYNVPFTFKELCECVKHYANKKYKYYNDNAYKFLHNHYERLLQLYPY